MSTYLIHIEGKVQGVGFRPFIYRLAKKLNMKGWVINQADGVCIKIQGNEDRAKIFFSLISAEAPKLAVLQKKTIEQIQDEYFEDFRIRKDDFQDTNCNLIITPDLAICPCCRKEIKDIQNRRYNYAFTTCTACGPRYSILRKLPYDRETIAMDEFEMCEACRQEYNDPDNRRFYSQTNSCPECPVQLKLYDTQKNILVTDDQGNSITIAVTLLKEGKILAVKGIGGYLLMCDATNRKTIEKLRERKKRPSKPFAVMYPDLHSMQEDVRISEQARTLVQSPESPVVLLSGNDTHTSGICWELIAPDLNKLGVMLPYTPLFELLLSQFSKPVIATSANVSGNAIVFRDEDALEYLTGIADFILSHSRKILIPQDDSVVEFSERYHQKIILRRSRGFAPEMVCNFQENISDQKLLALGADLKSTFAFTKSGNIYVSQYLGDLSSFENQKSFDITLQHFTTLLDFTPSLILTDKHPGYVSVQTGKDLAQKFSIPIQTIQHHEAHFASVLGENNLLDSQEPVLGVIWDGTGLGNDGLIRGGEFLIYQNYKISGFSQIEPFPHILQDKMPREPRIAALAIRYDLEESEELLRKKFTDEEWKIYHKILRKNNSSQSTSMGRIFDAIASFTGLCNRMSYEGEAAMLLESAAEKEVHRFELAGYEIEDFTKNSLPVKTIFRQVITDIRSGVTTEKIAARFHITLVKIIQKAAEHARVKRIAFSGGVFQNSLLVDLIIDKLGNNFQLYFHLQLPPNDECISFGQIVHQVIHHKTILNEREIQQINQLK